MTQTRILVVADGPDSSSASLAERFFAERVDAGSALGTVRRQRPDLVVVDLVDNRAGLDLCQRLREGDALRLMRIILVQSARGAEDRLLGYEAGADDVLSRPVNNCELGAKAHVFLGLQPRTQVEELKSGILAMVEHETRTPLTGVLSSAELLLGEDSMEDHERRAYVETIQECGERLSSLLERVMKLSAIKSGAWQLHVEPTCLAASLSGALHHVQGKVYQAEIKICLEGESESLVLADPRELGECLFALVDNAVRHAPPGSVVEIQVLRSAGDVCVAVRDYGVGVEAHKQEMIFEEFTSGDVLHHGGGNGLSLAIARLLMRQMGGDIEVASRVGDGATFTLRIPAAPDQTEEPPLADPEIDSLPE